MSPPTMLYRSAFLFLTSLSSLVAQTNKEQLALGKTQYETHCIACHRSNYQLVGPSLIEIASNYQKEPEAFIKWSIEPGKKSPDSIQMPSMAHVGEKNLRAVHAYILQATEGKLLSGSPKNSHEDPYPLKAERPFVQRIFLPDASPAAIAVALPDSDLNYCFDAGECRLRYVWQGEEFLTGWGHWKGNGSSLATLKGKKVYIQKADLLTPENKPEQTKKPKFLGYSLDNEGLPTFRYRVLGITYAETITALPTGKGIVRKITTDSTEPLSITTINDPAITLSVEPDNNPIPAEQAQSFTITQSWK